jgi:hypothetical protein
MRTIDRQLSGQGLKRAIAVIVCLASSMACMTAKAELSEPLPPAPNPYYFNLWQDSVTYGSGSGSLTGQLTDSTDTIWLCGTDNCSGDSGTGGTGYAEFRIDHTMPAGSGFIDPFQRLQHNEGECTGNCTTQLAYNTNNDDLQRIGDVGGNGVEISAIDNQVKDTGAGAGNANVFDDFNHAIQWETMFVDADGMLTFMLDINEPGTQCNGGGQSCDITSTLRLDELSFFIATTDDLSFYTPDVPGVDGGPLPLSCVDNVCSPTLATGNFNNDPLVESGAADVFKFWDMDFDTAFAGLLMDNIGGSAGSGDFDMNVRVPVTTELQNFVNANSGSDLFVYLYNFMGEADDLMADNGQVGTSGWKVCRGSGNNCTPVPEGDLDEVCGSDRSGCRPDNQDTGGATSGFEEWVYAGGVNTCCGDGGEEPVPLPSTVFLFGLGGLFLLRQRKTN